MLPAHEPTCNVRPVLVSAPPPQDAHIVKHGLGEGLEDVSLFCVFDGHGGESMSAAVSKEFVEAVRSGLVKYAAEQGATGKALITTPAAFEATLPSAFVNLDRELHRRVVSGTLKESGTTAVCVFVTPTHVICANSGDSRAIMVSKDVVIPLSFDHKPSNAVERTRIYAAGGVVSMDRVDGDLAVSRAFGDFRYKECASKSWEEQKVSVLPDIVVRPRDPTADQFIVVACDGIWDVMTNDEVGSAANALARRGATPDATSEFIIDECMRRNSRDNMSAIVVSMDAAPTASKEAVKSFEAARRDANQARAERSARGDPMDATSTYALRMISTYSSAGAAEEAAEATEEPAAAAGSA